jgi:hypothetical protein
MGLWLLFYAIASNWKHQPVQAAAAADYKVDHYTQLQSPDQVAQGIQETLKQNLRGGWEFVAAVPSESRGEIYLISKSSRRALDINCCASGR